MAQQVLNLRLSRSSTGIERLTSKIQRDAIWDFVDGFSRNCHILRESTTPSYVNVLVGAWSSVVCTPRCLTAQTYEAIVVTAIDVSFFARITCAVIYDWLNRNPRSHFDVVYTFPGLFNCPTEFVSQGQRYLLLGNGMRSRWDNACTTKIFMQV